MEFQNKKSKEVAFVGILITLSLIFSYIEAIIPFSLAVPGVKLGIANIVVILAIYILGYKEGVLISLIRVLLVSILFSGFTTFFFSMGGAAFSLFVMMALKETNKFSIVGVSMAGGVFHNLGQIIVAALFMGTTNIFIYFPILLFSGLATGIVIGIIAYYIEERFDGVI